jgi:hypothetical protein
MQTKNLKEMLMVIRPTTGNGLMPVLELESLLEQLGFEFLSMKWEDIGK